MKKQVRKMTNRTAGYIFFYNLIMVAVMFGAVAIRTIAIMAGAGSEQAADRAVGAFGQNMGSFLGILSIAGVCGGLLFLAIASRRTGLVREAFRSSRKMEAGNFIRIFCVFMACQTIFTVAALLAELVLNPFGLTLKNAAESASAVSGDLPMFLYASLIGPVAEELVFRGFVLRRLLGGGKGFAIVLSAVLFGAMHGNFLQGTFAVGAGLRICGGGVLHRVVHPDPCSQQSGVQRPPGAAGGGSPEDGRGGAGVRRAGIFLPGGLRHPCEGEREDRLLVAAEPPAQEVLAVGFHHLLDAPLPHHGDSGGSGGSEPALGRQPLCDKNVRYRPGNVI